MKREHARKETRTSWKCGDYESNMLFYSKGNKGIGEEGRVKLKHECVCFSTCNLIREKWNERRGKIEMGKTKIAIYHNFSDLIKIVRYYELKASCCTLNEYIIQFKLNLGSVAELLMEVQQGLHKGSNKISNRIQLGCFKY